MCNGFPNDTDNRRSIRFHQSFVVIIDTNYRSRLLVVCLLLALRAVISDHNNNFTNSNSILIQ
jgi:hypothetical protein